MTGDSPPWTLQSDEYYVRDVSGKEIAIYSGSSLTQWNIWGLDNVGKINADTTRNYYLKDHLGSTRVVLNSTNTVISAQDYDAWGYPLENRSYNASTIKYDFTGKERDNETSYDYFGARYYDSRIGRWGQVEPLLEKYFSFSPFSYIMCNPINYIDYDGRGGIHDRPQAKPWEGGGWGPVGVGVGIVGSVAIVEAFQAISDIITETIGNKSLSDIIEWLINPFFNENTNDEPEKTQGNVDDVPQYPIPEIDWENNKPKDDEWKAPKNPGQNWTKKDPKESLRNDTNHPPPKEPHWDWRDPAKIWWEIYKNGRVIRKN